MALKLPFKLGPRAAPKAPDPNPAARRPAGWRSALAG